MVTSTKTGFTGTNKQLAEHIINNLPDYTIEQEEKLRATNKRILDDMVTRFERAVKGGVRKVERDEQAVRGYGLNNGVRTGD